MDTGDLSEETYRAILLESENFNHDLTLQFGLLSGECEDEKDFIEQSVNLIEEMKAYSNIDLEDLFFGNPPKIKDFKLILKKILNNIDKVKAIPFKKRTFYYE